MSTNCHISEKLKASCDICERWPSRLHMPEDMHGWYCGQCCPACRPKALSKQPGAQEPVQEQGMLEQPVENEPEMPSRAA